MFPGVHSPALLLLAAWAPTIFTMAQFRGHGKTPDANGPLMSVPKNKVWASGDRAGRAAATTVPLEARPPPSCASGWASLHLPSSTAPLDTGSFQLGLALADAVKRVFTGLKQHRVCVVVMLVAG